MDPLIELPSEKWSVLRNLYETIWPEGAAAYCMLDSIIKVPNLVKDFDIKVYCPRGVMEYGMIMTSLRANFYELIVQPLGQDTTTIEESLMKTKVIDWNREIHVPPANDTAIKSLENIKLHLGLQLHYDETTIAFKHLLTNDAKKFSYKLPENTHVGPLTGEHLDFVNSTWEYNSEKSRAFFEGLKDNNLTYVMYSAENKPLSWITIDHFGNLKHLFTVEEYRSKGYAEMVTKCAINDLLCRNQHVLAYTLKDNEKSKNLFKKLGFKDIGFNNWMFINNTNK